jgi:hypothetical protein
MFKLDIEYEFGHRQELTVPTTSREVMCGIVRMLFAAPGTLRIAVTEYRPSTTMVSRDDLEDGYLEAYYLDHPLA